MTTKSDWEKVSKIPEPERMIELECEDWSPYSARGKFVVYKPGSGKRTGKSRLMTQDRYGTFSSDRDAWKDCIRWRYL